MPRAAAQCLTLPHVRVGEILIVQATTLCRSIFATWKSEVRVRCPPPEVRGHFGRQRAYAELIRALNGRAEAGPSLARL